MITLIGIEYNGTRVYDVDGKVVKVWPGSLFCQKCGRPLTDPHSQKIGYGPDCAPSHNHVYREMVVLAIGGEIPEKFRNETYHAVIKLVAPNTRLALPGETL